MLIELLTILFLIYINGVVLIKILMLFQYFFLPSHFITRNMTIKMLIVAWIWPIYILMDGYLSYKLDEWIHRS